MSKLFEDLSLSKGDGRYLKLLKTFAKTDLLILDDYGLMPLNQEQRHDFLEILEDRYNLISTLVASQLPIEHWHEQIGEPSKDKITASLRSDHLTGFTGMGGQIAWNTQIRNDL